MSGILVLTANLIQLYVLIIFLRVLISWLPVNPFNPIVQFISQITDPLLDAMRRSFPFLAAGGLDFSPIAVIFLLYITQSYLLTIASRLS